MRKAALIAITLLAAACAAPSTPSQSPSNHPHLPPPDFDAIEGKNQATSIAPPETRSSYLHYTIEESCGANGALGSERFAPEACLADYNPVCGCDGKTYSNACTANSNDVSAASQGPC